jgi:hypothetical protein
MTAHFCSSAAWASKTASLLGFTTSSERGPAQPWSLSWDKLAPMWPEPGTDVAAAACAVRCVARDVRGARRACAKQGGQGRRSVRRPVLCRGRIICVDEVHPRVRPSEGPTTHGSGSSARKLLFGANPDRRCLRWSTAASSAATRWSGAAPQQHTHDTAQTRARAHSHSEWAKHSLTLAVNPSTKGPFVPSTLIQEERLVRRLQRQHRQRNGAAALNPRVLADHIQRVPLVRRPAAHAVLCLYVAHRILYACALLAVRHAVQCHAMPCSASRYHRRQPWQNPWRGAGLLRRRDASVCAWRESFE